MEKTFWELTKLFNWEANPRGVNKKDFERLKNQLKQLGQYKPILITPEGEVLGGNMRLRAYKELGVEKVWVTIVEFKEEEGKWFGFLDGQKQEKAFETLDQAKLEYSLSDNDRIGFYQEDPLLQLISKMDKVNFSDYRVDLNYPVSIDKLLKDISPAGGDPDINDLDEKLETYLHGSIRQIVLYFGVEEYNQIIPRIKKIADSLKLRNNTDVFVKLLEYYERTN